MIQVWTDGIEFRTEEILAWENSRISPMKRILEKRLHVKWDIRDAEDFMERKARVSEEQMREALKRATKLVAFLTGAIVRLSGKRRKISVTEIDVDFCGAEKLLGLYFDMMLNNRIENIRCSLRANPEHFLLKGLEDNVQEVIEVTGGIILPAHFFIHYGDEAGMISRVEPDYPYQVSGVSYLKNGLAIGAVRHQMKDIGKGCHVKLSVEFPALMPDANIKAHQKHLACEFYNWFSEFERRLQNEQ